MYLDNQITLQNQHTEYNHKNPFTGKTDRLEYDPNVSGHCAAMESNRPTAKAILYLISPRNMMDQIIRPNQFNVTDNVINAISNKVVQKSRGEARRMDITMDDPAAAGAFIMPSTEATLVSTSAYSGNWTYFLVWKTSLPGRESRHMWTGVVDDIPVTATGAINHGANLVPHRTTCTKEATAYTGPSRQLSFIDGIADSVVVRGQERQRLLPSGGVDYVGNDVNSYDVNFRASVNLIDSGAPNVTGGGAMPAQVHDARSVDMSDIAPIRQTGKIVSQLTESVTARPDVAYSALDDDYTGVGNVVHDMASSMNNKAYFPSSGVSAGIERPDNLNPISIGELDNMARGDLVVNVISIPATSTMDLDIQNDNSRRSVLSAVIAQSIPSIAASLGISDISFRYDSTPVISNSIAPSEVGPYNRGVYQVTSAGALHQLDNDSMARVISDFMNQLMLSLFPAIQEAGGHFSVYVTYDHCTRILVNLNFLDDVIMRTDFIEYQSTLMGVTAPSVGSYDLLGLNADNIDNLIRGVVDNCHVASYAY